MLQILGNPDLAYEFLLSGIPSSNSASQGNTSQGNVGQGDMTSIDQLRQHPQFNTLKRVIQENPAALSQVLDVIGQQNPSLLAAIHNNNDAFLAMMNEPIVESHPDTNQPGVTSNLAANPAQMINALNSLPPEQQALFAQSMGMSAEQLRAFLGMMSSMPADEADNDPPGVVRLTQEEMDAVNRLMALGFSQQQAAQAYLACDKNEALAANLLLEGGWGDEENDFDNFH